MALSASKWAQVNDIALWVHATHDQSELQRGVLDRLQDAIPHRASFFDLCRVQDGRICYFDPVSTTLSSEDLAAYYDRYAAQDYTTWSFTPSRPTVYRDLDLVAPATRNVTPIYLEWMEPLGLYYGVGCTIVAHETIYGSITLFRSGDAEDFSDEEVDFLAQIERHLAVRFAQLWPQGFASDAPATGLAGLAARGGIAGRERDVLNLMAAGRTNREIARALFISESTVKKHVNSVYHKLGVKNRMQLARLLYP